jgi:hypothetical protein
MTLSCASSKHCVVPAAGVNCFMAVQGKLRNDFEAAEEPILLRLTQTVFLLLSAPAHLSGLYKSPHFVFLYFFMQR